MIAAYVVILPSKRLNNKTLTLVAFQPHLKISNVASWYHMAFGYKKEENYIIWSP